MLNLVLNVIINFQITLLQAYLVDWLNSMVMAQSFEHIVDSKLPEKPSRKELKRIILIALRCVDPDVENRPKMGDIIHMLEPRDLLLNDVRTTNYHFLRLTRYLKEFLLLTF